MFRLVKGNENNLEGKVIAYSRFSGNMSAFLNKKFINKILSRGVGLEELNERGRRSFFAMFSTSDLSDIFDKTGAPREYQEVMQNKVNEAIKGHDSSRSSFILKMFTAVVNSFSEEDIPIIKEDVIYTGIWTHPARCTESIMSALVFYNLLYSEQRNSGINNINIQAPSGYQIKDIPKKDIGDFIQRNYIGLMIEANKKGLNNEFSRLQSQFLKFSEGSHFMDDAISLCNCLRTGKGNVPDSRLISAYLGKIQAIEQEKYEEAAKFRDKIKSLSF